MRRDLELAERHNEENEHWHDNQAGLQEDVKRLADEKAALEAEVESLKEQLAKAIKGKRAGKGATRAGASVETVTRMTITNERIKELFKKSVSTQTKAKKQQTEAKTPQGEEKKK